MYAYMFIPTYVHMYTFMTLFSGKLQKRYALGTFGALCFTLIMCKMHMH